MDQSQGQPVLLRKKTTQATREQKMGFTMLAIVGGCAIILGSFYIARHLASPFDIDYIGPEFFTSSQQQQVELEEQKAADTDGDFISDYDELYVLRTSPYLADTDGDGLIDSEEIQAGTDPTCAEGAVCESTFGDPYQLTEGSAGFGDLVELPETEAPQTPEEAAAAFANVTPAEVRELLLSAGADPEELAGYTDEQLMALYLSVLEDVKSQAEAPDEAGILPSNEPEVTETTESTETTE